MSKRSVSGTLRGGKRIASVNANRGGEDDVDELVGDIQESVMEGEVVYTCVYIHTHAHAHTLYLNNKMSFYVSLTYTSICVSISLWL